MAVPENIGKYEAFLDDVLRKELAERQRARDEAQEKVIECQKLVKHLTLIKDRRLEELEMMVNLGCEFYARATVEDCSRVSVETSFGFFLEMTLEEAIEFLPKKETYLEERVKILNEQIVESKARITMFLNALSGMQGMHPEAPKPEKEWPEF